MDYQADCRRVHVGGLYVIIMITEFIWGIVNFLIYAAPFILQKIFFPNEPIPNEQIQNEPGTIIPLPIAALIPVVIFNVTLLWFRRKNAPTIDFDKMNFKDLYILVTRLRNAMETANDALKKIDDIEAHGWNPETLRKIVLNDWDKIKNNEDAAYLFDGDDDQQNWIEFFDRKYTSLLPVIMDDLENIVSWHLQNKYETKFFTVGEGGGGRAKRRISYLDWEAYSVECEACGSEIKTTGANAGNRDSGKRWGVTYGGDEYYFCCPRCRDRWMNEADGGRDFSGVMESWEEWGDYVRFRGGAFGDEKRVRRVRIGYLHYR